MNGYSSEKALLILISLLKKHQVKNVVISPGTTNVSLVASLQNDGGFNLFSAADERSAAYIACGLAAETQEPVMLSCTGATASRNYIPGLTEAYYRNLPILTVTTMRHWASIGQGIPQVIDRRSQLNDMVRKSVQIPFVVSKEDEWGAMVCINDALLELRRLGGGPVHINIATSANDSYGVSTLPSVRVINRICCNQEMPKLPKGKIAVFIGSHKPCSKELTETIDRFCSANNAIVLCDQTSNYRGKFRVLANLLSWQDQYRSAQLDVDLLIHMGSISGAYMKVRPKQVWRLSQRGDVQDTFKKLTNVFAMNEEYFFNYYSEIKNDKCNDYYNSITEELSNIRNAIPELPFSNLWCAQQMSNKLPQGCVIHFGILNSLRCWNLFETHNSITCYSNTGGFGIDGGVSTLIGASLANQEKLYYCVVGDLAFFYDLNSLGNRHVGKNVRIMLVNNGIGTEFKNYWHPASKFEKEADPFMAAAGHYGNRSKDLVKCYANSLGYKYYSASSKEEFNAVINEFCDPKISSQSMIFEVFTDSKTESDALHLIHNIKSSPKGVVKNTIRSIFGEKGVKAAKKIIGKS